MTWPANFQGCTLTGRYLGLDGSIVQGHLTLTAKPVVLLDFTIPTIILPRAITITLDSTGSFSQLVPATDDPDISPVDWTYTVTENFIGGRTYSIDAPMGQTLDLTQIAPVPDAAGDPIVRGPRGIDGSVRTVQNQAGDESGNVDVSAVIPLRENNLSDLTDPSAARSHLGLGSAAVKDVSWWPVPSEVLLRANNLGDLTDLTAAHAHLGLGDLAERSSAEFIANDLGTLATKAQSALFYGFVRDATGRPAFASGTNAGRFIYQMDIGRFIEWTGTAWVDPYDTGWVTTGADGWAGRTTLGAAAMRKVGRVITVKISLTFTIPVPATSSGNVGNVHIGHVPPPFIPSYDGVFLLTTGAAGALTSSYLNSDGYIYLNALPPNVGISAGDFYAIAGTCLD